jgi:Protein of unknown function (DUF2569)
MNNWTDGEAVKVEPQPGESIGGWLYMVAIGIILSPIMNALNVKQLVEAAQNANWDMIWQQGPVTMLSIIFEFGIQGYMLLFSIILAGLFFGRRKNFPKMFVIYVVSIFALGVIGATITASIPNIKPQLVGEAIASPLYFFILGLIWIPYFLKSKRVKRTFVIEGSPNE